MAEKNNEIDFSKICRLCLMEESVMYSVYNDTGTQSTTVPLQLRITACVSVELNSIDGLPAQICTTCLCQVDGWYKFKNLCKTADAVLKKCVTNEPVQPDTIAQIRKRAKEIRQFFASPHLVKIEGLDTALNQTTSSEEPMEIAIRKEDMETGPPIFAQKYLVYFDPDTYFKWLQSEYNLNEKIILKRIAKGRDDVTEYELPDYEIVFDSVIDKPKENIVRERVVMEFGDCQLLEVKPGTEDDVERGNVSEKETDGVEEDQDGVTSIGEKKKFRYRNPQVEHAVANYEKTKEYLENALRERGNTHEEVIENVLYSFHLDNDGNLDVVSIVEGVAEPHPQRGFRYTCLFCSKIVVNKLVYDKHIREDHLDYLICKVCDKQLYSLRNFLIHTKTHLGVYTFTCPLCGKGLTRASIFKSHMMYHYYGKIQKCQICDKKFRDVFALRRHVQLHDKKIEYICELCGFGTHLKSNLKYHVRAHADEKSFMCELCGKQFTAPQSLYHHLKTHQPKFPCPYCKRVYRHENKYKNHLELSHGETTKDEDVGERGED